MSQGEKNPGAGLRRTGRPGGGRAGKRLPGTQGKRLRGRLEGRVLKPYDDAATIRDNGSSAPVLAWLGDPMDLQFLQIQGSGRIQLEDGRQLRIGYGDQNGHPYKPVGRWLVEQGLVPKEEISMKRIPTGPRPIRSGSPSAGEQSQLRVLQPAPGQRRRSARLAERTADRRLQRWPSTAR
ncbi:MltA domain-containing protein [Pseudomonas aeruginosa]